MAGRAYAQLMQRALVFITWTVSASKI